MALREETNDADLWAAPQTRPSAGDEMELNDWARQVATLRPTSQRALEWYIECNFLGHEKLREVVQINPRRWGGVPVLKGSRFTVSQALAELAQSSAVTELAENYDLNAENIREMLNGLSLILMQPMTK